MKRYRNLKGANPDDSEGLVLLTATWQMQEKYVKAAMEIFPAFIRKVPCQKECSAQTATMNRGVGP
ncbi:hypothetical protein [Dyadobacter sediminis]|uniref:Uncharacterized protein n=1 Tax=Dyadobacter sediminis TaxID=1493691 RepID=A0A5R9KIQ3_9BACT|nr:hypothetical protein [Dyadobacter sediminis]TLU96097.1 hypothetical protein FEM55_02815 [Dyadobacter sediminis]